MFLFHINNFPLNIKNSLGLWISSPRAHKHPSTLRLYTHHHLTPPHFWNPFYWCGWIHIFSYHCISDSWLLGKNFLAIELTLELLWTSVQALRWLIIVSWIALLNSVFSLLEHIILYFFRKVTSVQLLEFAYYYLPWFLSDSLALYVNSDHP